MASALPVAVTTGIVNARREGEDSELTKKQSRRKPDSWADSQARGLDEALQRSEERYRLLFERNPQPMWVYDLSTLQFLAVNDAAVHTYGYSRREFLSMTLRDIRPPEATAIFDNYIVAGNLPGWAGLWKHRTKTGRDLFVEITDSHIDLEG